MFVNPPLNFNAIKPNETPYQRVNIRIITTIVNAKGTSIPCIIKKLTIFGNGEQTRDFTYVDDVVKATMNAATSDHVGEILNIGGGSVFSLMQITEFMKEITGKELEIDFEKEQKGDVKHTSADISKAEKLINYKSNTDIKYGLTQQYEYIKNNLNIYNN